MDFNNFYNKYFLKENNINYEKFIENINKKTSILLVLDENKLKIFDCYLQKEIELNINENYNNKIEYNNINGIKSIYIKNNKLNINNIQQCFLLITFNNIIDNLQIINESIIKYNGLLKYITSYIYIKDNALKNKIYYHNCKLFYDKY